MSILDEIRFPTRWYTKLLMAVFALLFFAVEATSAIAGFLVYRIVKPQRTSSEINMDSFPGRPDAMKFTVPGTGQHGGWFFPGFLGAPTIALCHGQGWRPGALLRRVSTRQHDQSHACGFDLAAHGAI